MLKNVNFNLNKVTKNHAKLLVYLAVLLYLFSCKTSHEEVVIISEELIITKLNNHSYIHTTYITLKNRDKFPCNGFIYTHNSEAYIFDTPVTDQATSELINWLQRDIKINIKGVVFNHFHSNCTEGINIFKEKGIETISSKKTASLMLEKQYPKPDKFFNDRLEIKLGNKTIINTFFGEAHTLDNIISYFPDEELIFGGRMIKSLNVKKGNLADANINEWSTIVSKIKQTYTNVSIVIPGHGAYGGAELLDYTISLFQIEK